ncbi:MAG TPA: PP2C family protein-serine/threonine phosphatase [Pseudogracilibacillus sp.]|nr:PP2C family protein-serine/threonine phosphatase [Pseudogracilibacillus sp.]
MQKLKENTQEYVTLLERFLETNETYYLDKAKEMSASFVDRNIQPEEIVRMHKNAVESLMNEERTEYKQSLDFLLESMIAYREALDEYKALELEQWELKSEIQIAANMQQTLLRTKKPVIEGVDIGALSVPHHQMNGDYYHFITGEDGTLGVAIADVIGKGVPAALSMSMIKYAMDSFYDELMSPSAILRNLNSVVERNVASNMFITMFYGQLFPELGTLRFASAGHEPGYIYRAEADRFEEIEAKGLVLGVLKNTHYKQYETSLGEGDMIVLLTDGVTECKRGERFIEHDEVIDIIREYKHLPAQEHVNSVYNHLNTLEDFELKDDFTLIIIKRV